MRICNFILFYLNVFRVPDYIFRDYPKYNSYTYIKTLKIDTSIQDYLQLSIITNCKNDFEYNKYKYIINVNNNKQINITENNTDVFNSMVDHTFILAKDIYPKKLGRAKTIYNQYKCMKYFFDDKNKYDDCKNDDFIRSINLIKIKNTLYLF